MNQHTHTPRSKVSTGLIFTTLAILLAMFCPRAEAEPYVPVEGVLEDRAFLFQLEKGTRRVRMQIRNPETDQWSTFSVAHLRGDEMYFKVRIPDDVEADDCRIHTSQSDPFPYSFYDGRSTTYSELEGPSSPTSSTSTGSLFAIDSATSASLVNTASADVATLGLNNGPIAGLPVADEVSESDIWQWRDQTLYFFNQQRGLQVIDASDPANPRKTATLRMPASGDQMYVLDDEHILLLTRSWNYHWAWGTSSDSEVVLVRHRDDELTVLNRYPLDGTFLESRLVGNRLYTVSRVLRELELDDETYVWRNTLEVRSLDLTDPDNPTSLEPLTLSGESESYFRDAVVTATANYFLVAPSFYDQEKRMTRSRVLTIPIGSGVSELKVTHEIEVRSRVADKFKLHERDGVLFVVTQDNQRWFNSLATSIESFDLSLPEITAPLGTLSIAPRERLHATRFHGDRLYVVTFLVPVRKDPLFVIDISDAANMEVKGELEVPGWANYLEPIANHRVLAVGVEDSKVAVSLYDVADAPQPIQLGRVFPGDGSWTTTEANFDERAFNFLPDEGLAMLPIESTNLDENRRESRMHLIDVTGSGLTERGSIPHEFKGRRATAFGDTVVSVSENKLLTVDITNRDNPVITASLPLAWGVERVAQVGDHTVHIQSGHRNHFSTFSWSYYRAKNSAARVHVTPVSDPETSIASLELPVGEVVGSLVSGSTLFLASILQEEVELPDEDGHFRNVWVTKLRTTAIDLSAPESPRISDTDDLLLTEGFSYRYSELTGVRIESGELLWFPNVADNNHSSGWGWNHWGYATFSSLSIDFLGSARYLGPIYSFVSQLEIFAYDVSNLSRLQFLSRTPVQPENLSKIGKTFLHGNTLMLSYKASTYDGLKHTNQYLVQEVSFENSREPQLSAPVNVPGSLEGTSEAGPDQLVLFTSTPKFRGSTQLSFQTSNALLQASVFDGDSAFLVDEISVEDGRYTPTIVSDRLVIKASWDWDFQGLKIYTWSAEDGRFSEAGKIDLGHVPESLRVSGDIIFAQSGGKLSAIPLESLFEPDAQQLTIDWPAFRYAIWLHRIQVGADRQTAWIPAGTYGLETVDLSPLALDPVPEARALLSQVGWQILSPETTSMVTASGTDAADSLTTETDYSVGAPVRMRLPQWRIAHFNPTNDSSVTLPEIGADSDLDGSDDLQEFLFGSNPLDPASLPRAEFGISVDSTSVIYSVSAAALEDVHLRLQSSVDLKTWQPLTEEHWTAEPLDTWMIELNLMPPADHGSSFVRIGVEAR